MANTAQAKKRARQAEQHRQRNVSMRTQQRGALKKVVVALDDKNKEQAQAAYVAAVPLLDRMARKGLIHKNKAARHKSRLNAHLRALSAA